MIAKQEQMVNKADFSAPGKANPCSHSPCIFVGKTPGRISSRLTLPKLHLATFISFYLHLIHTNKHRRMSRRTHWVALSPESSMHFRLSSSGERVDCWTEVRGTQGASLEDTDAQVACKLGTEWLKFGPSLGCGSAEEWDDHQRCDPCCPRRDGPGRISETGNDLLILLCRNACINRNKVLFITSNGIWVPQKNVFCYVIAEKATCFVWKKKKRREIRCGGITAWKSLLQFCFLVESLHLHEQPLKVCW